MAAKDIPGRLLSKLPFGGSAESHATESERSPSERSSTAPEPADQSVPATASVDEPAAASEPDEREPAEDGGATGGATGGAAERSGSSDSSREVDASSISAPSIGPNTVIVREDAEDRLARHEQSSKDAMGLDKRRSVIGGRYSASIGRQMLLYGVFIAVAAALVIGALVLVKDVDQAPASNPDAAPWAENNRDPTPLQ